MNRRVRVGVVGFGLVGKRHAQTIVAEPSTQLAAVADPTDCRNEVRSMDAAYFASLDELIDSQSIEGIVLATPTPLHLDQARRCIEAGIPILIEKPIATSAQEAVSIVDLAAARNVPVMVGHHRRFNGVIREAKRIIERGEIGKVRAITSTCWLYKPDQYFEEATWRTKKGAGPISVNLVHDIDLLRHFCGEVHRVQATSKPSLRGYENEDVAAAILNFQSGTVATVAVSDAIASPWSWELTARENPVYHATDQTCYQIGGSEGALSIPDLKLWRHEARPDWWSPIQSESRYVEATDPLIEQARHFADVIRGKDIPLVSALEGTRSLQVVEAIQNSANSGLPVDLAPVEISDAVSAKEQRIDGVA